MEKGIWRAARKAGDVGSVRPFIVAVPIVVGLGFLLATNLPYILTRSSSGGAQPPPFEILEYDGLSSRTVDLYTSAGVTLYLAFATLLLILELFRRTTASRLLLGQVMACAGVGIVCLLQTVTVASSTSRSDWVETIQADLARGSAGTLAGAIVAKQDYAEPLARTALQGDDPEVRMVAAAALWRLGDRSTLVRTTIRDGIARIDERYPDPSSVPGPIQDSMSLVARLLRDGRPVPDTWQQYLADDVQIPGGAYFRAWWERYRGEFE